MGRRRLWDMVEKSIVWMFNGIFRCSRSRSLAGIYQTPRPGKQHRAVSTAVEIKIHESKVETLVIHSHAGGTTIAHACLLYLQSHSILDPSHNHPRRAHMQFPP